MKPLYLSFLAYNTRARSPLGVLCWAAGLGI